MCAACISVGAAVIRCVLLFYYTDPQTGYVTGSGKELIFDLYVCLAVSIVLFALAAWIGRADAGEELVPGRGMFLLSLFSAAGMFYDFIYQCVNCYLYVSKTSFPAANRIVPMALCAVFALLSCAYFAVLCQCSRSSRFEFGRLWLLRLAPLCWTFCNVLVGLTEYGNIVFDVDSALKYLSLIFGMVFFFLLFASRESQFKRMGVLAFFGYSYGVLSFVLSLPRTITFIGGAGLAFPDFSAPAFLFTGVFAFAAALRISFKKKV